MPATIPSAAAHGCPYEMLTGRCSRPIHAAPPGVDPKPVCLMHSLDSQKDPDAFWAEIQTILQRPSKPVHDFWGFVFPLADFRHAEFTQYADFTYATFTQNVDFTRAKFTQYADFGKATFTQNADFTCATFTEDAAFIGTTFTQYADFTFARFTQDADFTGARFTKNAAFIGTIFTQNADFSGATFIQNANFGNATFTQEANFEDTTFEQVANFMGVRFEHPGGILFHRVNRDAPTGLKLRLEGCPIDGVQFVDVNWYIQKGRLVLADESDFVLGETPEVVAQIYRSLVNNFEKARQYEWAEQCIVSEMEMRRRNPDNFFFARRGPVARLYREHGWARWVGSHFSLTYLYRLFSLYGSSYQRAAMWLLVLVFALFPVVYGCSGMHLLASESSPGISTHMTFPPQPAPISPGLRPPSIPDREISWQQAWADAGPGRHRAVDLLYTWLNGLVLSAETVTFQRRPLLEPVGLWGRLVATLETVTVPAQLALFLLAIRRRFRR